MLMLIAQLPACKYLLAKAGDTPSTTGTYITLLHRFGDADAEDRGRLYERISTDAVLQPTASNRLRLALVKAWPDHSGHNLESARQLLESALAEHPKLTAEEKTLAGLYLLVVAQQQQSRRRTHTLASELQDALHKLEALTRIERAVEPIPPQPVPPDYEKPAKNPAGG
jgi:hypothetical protein